MAISQATLNSNYWHCCLFLAGDPSKYNYSRKDIIVRDNGSASSAPYIHSWTVSGVAQPTNAQLLALTQANIDAVKAVLP